MARGGARPGAGRKSVNEAKASAAVRKIVEQRIMAARVESVAGITPLEIMQEAMMEAREQGNLKAAAQFAAMAAPYVHPKLASVTNNNTVQGQLTIVSEFPA
jgi:hypothetical protein